MANRLTDLDVGHAYAPRISNFANDIEWSLTSEPSGATVVFACFVALLGYTIVWKALTT